MKKIYSFIVAAVAILATAACTQELENVAPEATGETVVYTASMDEGDTKAVLDGVVSKWKGEELITLHDGTNAFTFYGDAGETPTTTIDFSYTQGEGQPAFTATEVMAVYPSGDYTADLTTKTVSNVVIPENQTLVDNTYPATAAVALAYSTDKATLNFKNAITLLKFKVAGDDVTYGCFSAGGNISGTFDIAYNDGNPLLTPTTEKQWVDFHKNGEFLSKEATYYIAVAPATLSDFTMYLNGDEIKSYDTEYQLKRSVILDLGTLNYTAPEKASTVYLKPGAWSAAGAWYVAYFFNSTGNIAVNMTDSDSDGLFEASVPEGDYSKVIFCRMNPAFTEFGWDVTEGETVTEDHVWNQTENLNVPVATDDKLCYVVKDWDVYEWQTIEDATYVAPEWAIAGTFNEWSTTANPMTQEGDYYVAKNVTGLNYSDPNEGETGSSTGIKFVNNGDTWRAGEGQVTAGTWAYVYGEGGNIYVAGATAETAYDIYLNPAEGDYGKFVIVAAGEAMPEDGVVEPDIPDDVETITYYMRPTSSWEANNGRYAAWGWGTSIDGAWYDFSDSDADGIYELTVPVTVESVIFLCMTAGTENDWANELARTSDLTLLSDDKNCYNVYTSEWVTIAEAKAYDPTAIYAEEGWVYLKPNSNWTQANARFAIYFFGAGEKWVSMTKVSGTDYYGVKISDIVSSGYTGMIFCRMNPGATANNWDNKWNQSGDLTVSTFTSGKNCFTVQSGTWDGATTAWSTVTKLN